MSDAVFTFTYDTDYRPALPIIEMGISVINPDASEISLSAIVDSGSDVTLIPVTILRRAGSTGRNVLNQLVVTLDGPAATTMIAA